MEAERNRNSGSIPSCPSQKPTVSNAVISPVTSNGPSNAATPHCSLRESTVLNVAISPDTSHGPCRVAKSHYTLREPTVHNAHIISTQHSPLEEPTEQKQNKLIKYPREVLQTSAPIILEATVNLE